MTTGPGWDLRCGRYQDALADVGEVDAVICDPPYSDRTHSSYCVDGADGAARKVIGYQSWGPDSVRGFVDLWAPRCRGWIVAMTDSELYPAWRDVLRAAGLCVFAPLPLVSPGSSVRLTGDGPSSVTCWIVVARPRSGPCVKWGTLPGYYLAPPGEKIVMGGKPLAAMRAVVRDYTRPGDLICDPCAGGGTTLLAAVMEGRRAIGSEMDPATHAKAVARLQRGYTPPLIVSGAEPLRQGALL